MPARSEKIYTVTDEKNLPGKTLPFPRWWDRHAFLMKYDDRKIDVGNPMYVDYVYLLTKWEAQSWDKESRQTFPNRCRSWEKERNFDAEMQELADAFIIKKTFFPKYPPDLLAAGIEGTVTIEFIINKKGRVTEPVIVQSAGDEFDKASIACLKKWRFEPILKDGQPVDTKAQHSFEFVISK